jgi:peptide/nickel transport system permease protein
MGRYLLVRLGWAIPIVLAIVIINFMIVHIVPGDPVQALVGDFPTPPGYIEQVRQEFGLDRPLTQQLVEPGTRQSRVFLCQPSAGTGAHS